MKTFSQVSGPIAGGAPEIDRAGAYRSLEDFVSSFQPDLFQHKLLPVVGNLLLALCDIDPRSGYIEFKYDFANNTSLYVRQLQQQGRLLVCTNGGNEPRREAFLTYDGTTNNVLYDWLGTTVQVLLPENPGYSHSLQSVVRQVVYCPRVYEQVQP